MSDGQSQTLNETLVAYYGEKPANLAGFFTTCHQKLSATLGAAFKPYELPQIHATLIGLESVRINDRLVNANYLQLRNLQVPVEPRQILEFVRELTRISLEARIGGYLESTDYGVTSRGQHLSTRSFSLQRGSAVVMGWNVRSFGMLGKLRRAFTEVNVLHKYHRSDDDQDNDLYFVIGRIDDRLATADQLSDAESNMRTWISQIDPITVYINQDTLRLVRYSDPALPLATSHAFRIADALPWN